MPEIALKPQIIDDLRWIGGFAKKRESITNAMTDGGRTLNTGRGLVWILESEKMDGAAKVLNWYPTPSTALCFPLKTESVSFQNYFPSTVNSPATVLYHFMEETVIFATSVFKRLRDFGEIHLGTIRLWVPRLLTAKRADLSVRSFRSPKDAVPRFAGQIGTN